MIAITSLPLYLLYLDQSINKKYYSLKKKGWGQKCKLSFFWLPKLPHTLKGQFGYKTKRGIIVISLFIPFLNNLKRIFEYPKGIIPNYTYLHPETAGPWFHVAYPSRWCGRFNNKENAGTVTIEITFALSPK